MNVVGLEDRLLTYAETTGLYRRWRKSPEWWRTASHEQRVQELRRAHARLTRSYRMVWGYAVIVGILIIAVGGVPIDDPSVGSFAFTLALVVPLAATFLFTLRVLRRMRRTRNRSHELLAAMTNPNPSA